jgi:hypothetical protein
VFGAAFEQVADAALRDSDRAEGQERLKGSHAATAPCGQENRCDAHLFKRRV